MLFTKDFFLRTPGDDFGTGGISPDENDIEKKDKEQPDIKEEGHEKKPFMEKVREALQDWSNDDQADTAYDDTHPQSSNL